MSLLDRSGNGGSKRLGHLFEVLRLEAGAPAEPPEAKWTVVLVEGEDAPRAAGEPSVEAETVLACCSTELGSLEELPSTLGREDFLTRGPLCSSYFLSASESPFLNLLWGLSGSPWPSCLPSVFTHLVCPVLQPGCQAWAWLWPEDSGLFPRPHWLKAGRRPFP